MKRSPQVRVTFSDDLLNHLRKTAQEQHVPLRWLVAGLVCDTLEARAEHHKATGRIESTCDTVLCGLRHVDRVYRSGQSGK